MRAFVSRFLFKKEFPQKRLKIQNCMAIPICPDLFLKKKSVVTQIKNRARMRIVFQCIYCCYANMLTLYIAAILIRYRTSRPWINSICHNRLLQKSPSYHVNILGTFGVKNGIRIIILKSASWGENLMIAKGWMWIMDESFNADMKTDLCCQYWMHVSVAPKITMMLQDNCL